MRTADEMTDEEWGRLPGAVTKHYGPCPGCELRRAGSLHRGSARLWQGRAGRARENDGTDPVSDVTLDDAERHLAAIGDEEGK